MTKQCVNNECNAFIDNEDRHCRICGFEQPNKPTKKGFSFLKKKEQQAIPVRLDQSENLEDFRLTPEYRKMQQLAPVAKKDNNAESLTRIEEKLDVILKNHGWLVANVDAWLQGYRQREGKEEEETEK